MIRLSKSKYISGLQCSKLLWWCVHEPGAPELVPDETLQAIFDMGHRVTEKAREAVPGGVLIDVPYTDRKGRLRATREAIESGAPVVYEVAVEHEGVMVLVDILEKSKRGWNLVEVKSSTSVKPQHLPDAAVQRWVLEGAGLPVARVELMHLNRECRFPDLSNLFTREEITDDIAEDLEEVPGRLREMKRMLEGKRPDVAIGEHCSDPYECAFTSRCWAEVPENSVHDLYRLRQTRAFELWREGFEEIARIPEHVGLSAIQERQKEALVTGRMVVAPGLARALETLKKPVTYLDFETIWPAIPVWDGMRPYDQAPVQLSVHRENRKGGLVHHEWLPESGGDPREPMARKILEFTEGAGSIVVYNVGFERARIRELSERFPSMAEPLEDVEARLWDLLPVVRNHLYHPEFNGSFSIKSVLPALVPGEGYGGMEISEGGEASRMLERLFLDPDLADDEREAMRKPLLEYCAQDTLAIMKLMNRLREIAETWDELP